MSRRLRGWLSPLLLVVTLVGCARPLRGATGRAAPPTAASQDRFEQSTLPAIDGELVARMHLIDVGQGAATLLELSCGVVLIDTGGEAGRDFSGREALSTYLEAFFARRADLTRTIALLVVTHPHIDHTRNLELVVADYVVENVVTDGRTSGSGAPQQRRLQAWAAENAHLQTIASESVPAGGLTSRIIDPLRCKDVDPEIHALWGSVAERPRGWTREAFEDENNHSVVVRIDAARASFLVGGDLETQGMDAVIAKHRGTGVLDVGVLEINHHGSDNGTSASWLDATSPDVALAAMGPAGREQMWTAWAYGHPRKSVLDRLLASTLGTRPAKRVAVGTGAKAFETVTLSRAVYGTGWDGDVVVDASRDGTYRVRTRR